MILGGAARLVKPGGHLIYATCSLLIEENEIQIENFLAGNPAFSALPVSDIWSRNIPAPARHRELVSA